MLERIGETRRGESRTDLPGCSEEYPDRRLGDYLAVADRHPWGRTLGGNQLHGQLLMTTDHEAVCPRWWIIRIQCDGTGPGQQNAENVPGFNPSKGCPNTMMDTPAERHMPPQDLPIEVDGIRMFKHLGVTVGRTPEQEECCPGWDLYTPECSVMRHGTHVIAEWRL